MLKVSKAERCAVYCNHPENELSYAVYNGDDSVMDGVEYSLTCTRVTLCCFAATVWGCYVQFERTSRLAYMTAQEMLSASKAFDKPPFAEYADDKALLKLTF